MKTIRTDRRGLRVFIQSHAHKSRGCRQPATRFAAPLPPIRQSGVPRKRQSLACSSLPRGSRRRTGGVDLRICPAAQDQRHAVGTGSQWTETVAMITEVGGSAGGRGPLPLASTTRSRRGRRLLPSDVAVAWPTSVSNRPLALPPRGIVGTVERRFRILETRYERR